MKQTILELGTELRTVAHALNSESPANLKIFARRLAAIEMRLQAARSLMEARMFEAEADRWEDEQKQLNQSLLAL